MLFRPPASQPVSRRFARFANVWSGALVCSAFANLHTAKVVLVDLYAEEDIQAAAPGVLARLQACLPARRSAPAEGRSAVRLTGQRGAVRCPQPGLA